MIDAPCTCGKPRSEHYLVGMSEFCPGSETRRFDLDPAYVVGSDEYRRRIEREGQLTIEGRR